MDLFQVSDEGLCRRSKRGDWVIQSWDGISELVVWQPLIRRQMWPSFVKPTMFHKISVRGARISWHIDPIYKVSHLVSGIRLRRKHPSSSDWGLYRDSLQSIILHTPFSQTCAQLVWSQCYYSLFSRDSPSLHLYHKMGVLKPSLWSPHLAHINSSPHLLGLVMPTLLAQGPIL